MKYSDIGEVSVIGSRGIVDVRADVERHSYWLRDRVSFVQRLLYFFSLRDVLLALDGIDRMRSHIIALLSCQRLLNSFLRATISIDFDSLYIDLLVCSSNFVIRHQHLLIM